MRIFRAMLALLLIVIFIAMLASAYVQYNNTLSAVGLVDATTSITNHLVLYTLAYESGGNVQEYVIDPAKIISIEDFRQEIGGENFEFQLTLFYSTGERENYGPAPAEGKAVAALFVPVSLHENNRVEFAKLGVKAWRA